MVETEFKLPIIFLFSDKPELLGVLKEEKQRREEERRRLRLIENHPILPPSPSPAAKITVVCLSQVDQGAADTGVKGAAGRAL